MNDSGFHRTSFFLFELYGEQNVSAFREGGVEECQFGKGCRELDLVKWFRKREFGNESLKNPCNISTDSLMTSISSIFLEFYL